IATGIYPASGATSLTFDASAVATSIVAPVDEHLIEYPAGSGRLYHRRDDGAVLRAETLIDGTWRDLTCDVIECSIRTGDTSGTTLVPTAEAGQAPITLRDVDGRYGAPGNYRVSTLVGFVHSPAGTGYSTVVEATASHRMMQSPGGKVLDLVNKVASSDLAYFWWQPAVDPVDHDGFGDYFTYQPFDT